MQGGYSSCSPSVDGHHGICGTVNLVRDADTPATDKSIEPVIWTQYDWAHTPAGDSVWLADALTVPGLIPEKALVQTKHIVTQVLPSISA